MLDGVLDDDDEDEDVDASKYNHIGIPTTQVRRPTLPYYNFTS